MNITKHKLGFENDLGVEEFIKIANRYVNNDYIIYYCNVFISSNNVLSGEHCIELKSNKNDKKFILLRQSSISFRNFEKNEVFNEIDEILKIINQEDKKI